MLEKLGLNHKHFISLKKYRFNPIKEYFKILSSIICMKLFCYALYAYQSLNRKATFSPLNGRFRHSSGSRES